MWLAEKPKLELDETDFTLALCMYLASDMGGTQSCYLKNCPHLQILCISIDQWPFQEPKLEARTCRKYHHKIWSNIWY